MSTYKQRGPSQCRVGAELDLCHASTRGFCGISGFGAVIVLVVCRIVGACFLKLPLMGLKSIRYCGKGHLTDPKLFIHPTPSKSGPSYLAIPTCQPNEAPQIARRSRNP